MQNCQRAGSSYGFIGHTIRRDGIDSRIIEKGNSRHGEGLYYEYRKNTILNVVQVGYTSGKEGI